MASRTIRIDPEVAAALAKERQPGERNYSAAIERLLAASQNRPPRELTGERLEAVMVGLLDHKDAGGWYIEGADKDTVNKLLVAFAMEYPPLELGSPSDQITSVATILSIGFQIGWRAREALGWQPKQA